MRVIRANVHYRRTLSSFYFEFFGDFDGPTGELFRSSRCSISAAIVGAGSDGVC